MKKIGLLALTIAALTTAGHLTAPQAEAGLFDVIRADLEYRRHIRQMHITERPNRPIHIYGNTVRHRHMQGKSILY